MIPKKVYEEKFFSAIRKDKNDLLLNNEIYPKGQIVVSEENGEVIAFFSGDGKKRFSELSPIYSKSLEKNVNDNTNDISLNREDISKLKTDLSREVSAINNKLDELENEIISTLNAKLDSLRNNLEIELQKRDVNFVKSFYLDADSEITFFLPDEFIGREVFFLEECRDDSNQNNFYTSLAAGHHTFVKNENKVVFKNDQRMGIHFKVLVKGVYVE